MTSLSSQQQAGRYNSSIVSNVHPVDFEVISLTLKNKRITLKNKSKCKASANEVPGSSA